MPTAVTSWTRVLLAAFVSAWSEATLAVLFRVPIAVGATAIVIVALWPTNSEPRGIVSTEPVGEYVAPSWAVAERKAAPAGKVSVRTTFVAVLGPLLVTVTLYVRGECRGAGSADTL